MANSIVINNPYSQALATNDNVISSVNYTVPTGARKLVVAVYVDNANVTVPQPDLCDYNGVALSPVQQIATDSGGTGQLHFIYELDNPPAGTFALRARHPTIRFYVGAFSISATNNITTAYSTIAFATSNSPSVSISTQVDDVLVYSLTVNNVDTTAVSETGGQTVISEGGSSVQAMHQLSSETAVGTTTGATWTVSSSQRWSAGIVRIREDSGAINSITDPVVIGENFTINTSGFANGSASFAIGGQTIPLTIASNSATAQFPEFYDEMSLVFLPAAGVTGTLTQGAKSATASANIALPDGFDVTRDDSNNPANFADVVIDDPKYPGYHFNLAGNPWTTDDRCYWNKQTIAGKSIKIHRNGKVEVPEELYENAPYVVVPLWVNRGTGSKIYLHEMTVPKEGGIIQIKRRHIVTEMLSSNFLNAKFLESEFL